MVGVEISDGSVIRGDSHRDTENGDTIWACNDIVGFYYLLQENMEILPNDITSVDYGKSFSND
jgi:hypothetical protein